MVRLTRPNARSYFPKGKTMGAHMPIRGYVNEYGLTAKQEDFARAVASGGTLSDAYRSAYNSKTANIATINHEASRVANNPKVAARIKALLVAAEKRMMRDAVHLREHVIRGLLKESGNDDAKPAERIRALELIGKIDIVSMFKDRVEEKAADTRKPEDIEAELRQRLRDMFQ